MDIRVKHLSETGVSENDGYTDSFGTRKGSVCSVTKADARLVGLL
jgi:hypothetical protein